MICFWWPFSQIVLLPNKSFGHDDPIWFPKIHRISPGRQGFRESYPVPHVAMLVSARHASVVWTLSGSCQGRWPVSLILIRTDIDVYLWDWLRWVMHSYFFQDGLTTYNCQLGTSLQTPGFRFRLQWLRRCDGLLCRSCGCGVIWTFWDPASLCIDRFDWESHLLQDYYRDLSLASDDKWRNMAKQKEMPFV